MHTALHSRCRVETELQKDLRTHFGLDLPQNSVKTILTRVHKEGYVRSENKVYHRCPDKLGTLGFQETQQRVLEMHDALIRELRTFCQERFDVQWSTEDGDAALQSYMEENQLTVVDACLRGVPIPPPTTAVRNARFLVGAFVQHLWDTKSPGFNYLETVVKGNIIATAVFLPDPGSLARNFRNTELYFDTTFLIYALGYAGAVRKEPCAELLELLCETGATLRCFLHTLDEIRGVLQACAWKLESGDLRTAYGPSIEYFLTSGCTAADIRVFAGRVEEDLAHLRVKVVRKPLYDDKYVIDEAALEEQLGTAIPYRNLEARHRDVDSVAAIMRLRRGREFSLVEDCRALFVTTNGELVRVAREFFYAEALPGTIPPCMTDYAMTNLVWLKRPVRAPDLPRKRIVADCYAATQPGDSLWARYLEEIDKLNSKGEVCANDWYLLRHSLEAKHALMEVTKGEEGAFAQGTVPEILEIVRSQIVEEERKRNIAREDQGRREFQEERAAREAAEKAVQEAEHRESLRVRRRTERAQRFARWTFAVVKALLLLLLGLGSLSTFPWGLPPLQTGWLRYSLTVVQAMLLLLVVCNLMWGTTVQNLCKKLEVSLQGWVERRLTAM